MSDGFKTKDEAIEYAREHAEHIEESGEERPEIHVILFKGEEDLHGGLDCKCKPTVSSDGLVYHNSLKVS